MTGARAGLEAEREGLLRSLSELEAERAAGDIDAATYERLKSKYTAEAADVLRALNGDGGPTPSAAPPRAERRWRALVTTAGVLVVAVLAGVAVSSSAGERMPDEQITGSVAAGTNDLILRAQLLVSEGEVLEAVKLYDEVLERDPEHPVALAQRGWLISRAGLLDEGLVYVDRAIEVDPRYPDARFFRAMILRDQSRPAEAAAELRRLLALEPPPDVAQMARGVLAAIEAEATPSTSGPTEQRP